MIVERKTLAAIVDSLVSLRRERTLPFGLHAYAAEINNPERGNSKLVGIACWASFAVWTSIAGSCPRGRFLQNAWRCSGAETLRPKADGRLW
jgi:hypothetical protein